MIDLVFPHLWIGCIVFVRVGAILMLAPGIGEASVPSTVRLSVALLVSVAMAPGLVDLAPSPPTSAEAAVPALIGEALIGMVLGMIPRLLMSAVHVAGQVAGLQCGLGLAQQFDPGSSQSSAVLGVFLSMLSVCLVMAAGIHRLMLRSIVDSYLLFPPGRLPPTGDLARVGIAPVADAFSLGLSIAAPVLAFGLIFNLALGLINRLIPQVQIFFVALPSSILLGLSVMATGMGAGLWLWLEQMGRYARLEQSL